MKHLKIFAVIVVIALLIGSLAAISYVRLNKEQEEQKPFYVGVTYCGNSVQEAKELIDKVKKLHKPLHPTIRSLNEGY